MSITEKQDAIISEFEVFDDWMDKYQYIIELSKRLPPIDETKKVEQYIIKGCQSNVWLDAQFDGTHVYYFADSDALITKGIVSLLIRVLSGHTPQEIIDSDLYFIEKIGLKENLSPTRSNGLLAMIKQMRYFAMAFQHKSAKQ
ncbi:MAG: SufE family protein [Bacteroidales bacterium]